MIEVNAKKARGELSSLLKRVEEGELVVISRRERKVAKMEREGEDWETGWAMKSSNQL